MFPRGELVVKLPKARVDELVDAGAGRRFDPGHGRVMKEWIVVAPGKADWLPLPDEAVADLGGGGRPCAALGRRAAAARAGGAPPGAARPRCRGRARPGTGGRIPRAPSTGPRAPRAA